MRQDEENRKEIEKNKMAEKKGFTPPQVVSFSITVQNALASPSCGANAQIDNIQCGTY